MQTEIITLPPLGKEYENTQPPPSFFRLQKWALQAASRSILPSERVSFCNRKLRMNLDEVSILHAPKYDSYHYGNLMVCGSVWTCPVCAAKITERRRQELAALVDEAIGRGNSVAMLTLTVPHHYGDDLSVVLDRLSRAKRLMQNRKVWKRLVSWYGILGDVRTLEVTYGKNGWHPHFHCLLFFDKQKLSVRDKFNLRRDILSAWQSACLSCDLPKPNGHGCTLQVCNRSVYEYVQKWGVDREMTKGHVGKSAVGGRTPFQLLQAYLDGDKIAGSIFREFAEKFKGRRQLVYSKGLRSLFNIVDLSDEELATSDEEDATIFMMIPLDVWRSVLRADRRGQLLEVCRNGKKAVEEFLSTLLIQDPYAPCELDADIQKSSSEVQRFESALLALISTIRPGRSSFLHPPEFLNANSFSLQENTCIPVQLQLIST